MKKWSVSAIVIFLCLNQLVAQQLANVKASQVNGLATVMYDIQAPPTQTYFVKLLYSTDGGNSFSEELKFVNGDVRSNVTGGAGKKISWNSKQEVGNIEGNVVFKVTAESKMKLPAPIENENGKFQFLDIRRENGTLVIDFQITPKKDMEFVTYASHNTIYDNLGNKSDASRISAEGAGDNYGYGYRFEKLNLTGIPFKGSIAFSFSSEASSVSLLKLQPGGYISSDLRNIAIPK